MITSQKELKREIFSRASKLSEAEIFLSKAYTLFLEQIQKGLLLSKNRRVNVRIVDDGKEGCVAYTDGNETVINIANPYTTSLTQVEKHRLYIGLILHETGHLLFTDFSLMEKICKKLIYDGNIFPPMGDVTEDVEEYIAEGGDLTVLAQMLQRISNITEDGFVDRAVVKLTPGYKSCLAFVEKIDKDDFSSFKEMKDKGLPDEEIFLNLILSYARHGVRAYDETDSADVIEAVKEVEPIVRRCVREPIPMKRAKINWEILNALLAFLKKSSEEKDEEEGEGESTGSGKGKGKGKGKKSESKGSESSESSESSEGSEGEGKKSSALSSLEKALKELGQEKEGKLKTDHRHTESPDAETIEELSKELASEEDGDSSDGSSSEAGGENSSELSHLAEEAAKEKIASEQEENIKVNLKDGACEEIHGIHSKCLPNIVREEPSAEGLERYEVEHGELDAIVRRFVRTFEDEIKERQTGDTYKGLYNGKRLTSNEVYRKDKKIFSNKRLPEDIPDMAVGILVDLSGSMFGERMEAARKCAYITYKFCTQLSIPVFVLGHCEDFGSWREDLVSVADENCLDGKDAMRILSLEAGGNNRDGYALRCALAKLEKMDAEQKMMLVISDGQPAARDYSLYNGRPDCQEAVSKALKKGIFTVCAGIGSDAGQVKAVYKEGVSEKNSASFLEISDLDKLPKSFIKILKTKLDEAG